MRHHRHAGRAAHRLGDDGGARVRVPYTEMRQEINVPADGPAKPKKKIVKKKN